MADLFTRLGYHIVSGGTDNHLMLIDLRPKFPEVTGKEAEKALVNAHITINKNMVPFDTRPAMQTSGIRIGTAAITSRGFTESDCETVATWVDEAIQNRNHPEHLAMLKNKVHDFMESFPLYS